MLDLVADPPKTLPENSKELETIFHFFWDVVARGRGWKKIKTFLQDNKGKAVLDFITISDIAHCRAVIENSKDVWDQAYEVSTLDLSERINYKNPGVLPESEREKYARKTPKYTSRVGKKLTYLDHGQIYNAGIFYLKLLSGGWNVESRCKIQV